MRFLMLNWRDPKNPEAGGAERVSEGYWRGLLERGHEVWWFAFSFPGAPAEENLDGLRRERDGDLGGLEVVSTSAEVRSCGGPTPWASLVCPLVV